MEPFTFLQRDNSNDRLRYFQWLLNRKPASISNTENHHLDSATTEPYFPNDSITIDDSSDEEQVTNLMLHADNLSRVPPFNILDSETRRNDVSLHVPLMADPDAEQDLTVSPTQRRSSRSKRTSLSNDAREPSSSDSTSKRSKVSDKSSSAMSISAPIITSDTLRVNKSLIDDKKLKKYVSYHSPTVIDQVVS
jgi:hypothetical protein